MRLDLADDNWERSYTAGAWPDALERMRECREPGSDGWGLTRLHSVSLWAGDPMTAPAPSDLPTFVVLSFEGPDPYARAGGLGARVTELSEALADAGYEVHLFFIGDPDLPGHDSLRGGKLHLHRWCQWISTHRPGGVYDGEDAKLEDWNRSLVPWITQELMAPRIAEDHHIVVLAEEWQTAKSVIELARETREYGWRDQVDLFWNANHFFGHERVDWAALRQAATITTVSRYMRHVLAQRGVDARVVPNGISETWFWPLDGRQSRAMHGLLNGRLSLVKVARWDPDKGWPAAVAAVSDLKQRGLRPLFIARGGHERYGRDVLRRMRGHGLEVGVATWHGNRPSELIEAMAPVVESDVIMLDGFLSLEQRRLLFRAADAVLANSTMEPFGLVGLETMAVGGVAFVGSTGEDYATPGHDAVCIETPDPQEIVHHVLHLYDSQQETRRLRDRARRSARRYSWPSVLNRRLFPLLHRSTRRALRPGQRPLTARDVSQELPLLPLGSCPKKSLPRMVDSQAARNSPHPSPARGEGVPR